MGKWYFPATNKPSSNDFYPNNRRVIIFLIWFLLLVILFFLSFVLDFGFYIDGFAGSDHNTNGDSQLFSRLPSIFLGDVYGSMVWFVWKIGVLILLIINRRGEFDGHNHHVKAAAASSPLASLHGWRQVVFMF